MRLFSRVILGERAHTTENSERAHSEQRPQLHIENCCESARGDGGRVRALRARVQHGQRPPATGQAALGAATREHARLPLGQGENRVGRGVRRQVRAHSARPQRRTQRPGAAPLPGGQNHVSKQPGTSLGRRQGYIPRYVIWIF